VRVALLHNTVSPEAGPDQQDVLVQVQALQEALAILGHRAVTVGCDLDLQSVRERLDEARAALAFNLVEGLGGHGRLIHLVPDLLEALGIPYAGCPAEGIYATSHKLLAKRTLRAAGLPTPNWFTSDGLADDGRADVRDGDDRWIVKSVWEDASLGMDDAAVVDSLGAARRAVARRSGAPGAPWFAEQFIEGREFNLSLLDGSGGVDVLPAAELIFTDFPEDKPRIVSYAAKWDEDSFEYRNTTRSFEVARADEALVAELTALARRSWDLFALRGWARVDFRVDRNGRPWILEVNANPCLSPDAGFAAAVGRAGLTFPDAVARILATAGCVARQQKVER
jgi:D-alanine-D-alanine ligase